MPHTSRQERIARLRRALVSPDRWVEARLVVESHTGEELFRIGGCWDRELRRYVDRPCKERRISLQESQLELGRAFGRWLAAARAGERRSRVLIGGGNRGSGKTWFLAGVGLLAMALEFPGDWQFAVNITAKQKRECLEAIREVGVPEWISGDITDFRDPRTVFVTGSTVCWLSAQNPRAIRQAGLTIRYVLINEGQDQPQAVAINAIAAIRNTGGLVGIATNPPQSERSDWVASWWTGIEAGDLNGEKYFVDNKLNRAIDQAAVGDIAPYLYAIDRDAGDADGAGVFKLSGPTAYPAFSSLPLERGGHVGNPPARVVSLDGTLVAGWEDVTAELTASAVDSGAGFPFVCGLDFQREPGVIGSIAKLYRDGAGKIVLHVIDTIGVRGVESDFSQALHAAGYRPVHGMDGPTVLLVGDGTGARQNSEHRRGLPTSFVAMRADGWKIVGPMKHWKTGIWWNPLVKDSRAQMHAVLDARQLLLSPKCKEASEGFPSLVESFRSAKVGPKGGLVEKGNYQHGPDGIRYLCWRFLPRPAPAKPTGFDMTTFDSIRKIRILNNG
jgi:hypothetical protein